jgi:CRP/FNR family transcriptional regulator, cyclic AMP receptor protein
VSRRDRFRSSLKQIPMFAACTKAELERVTLLANPVDIAAGEILTREGRSGGEFMVIVEGRATVTRSGAAVRTLGPGDWVGEIALLDGGPRTATVVADTAMVVEVIARKDFLDLLREVPTVAIKIAVGLAHTVRELENPVAAGASAAPAPDATTATT